MSETIPATPEPQSATVKRRDTGARRYVDDKLFFDTQGAAEKLGLSVAAVLEAVQRGSLVPARVGKRRTHGLVYTHTDLERYAKRDREGGLERAIVQRLKDGLHPVDAYLETHAQGARLHTVLRLTETWARLAGLWLVQGPPGSYARWLERVGLRELKHLHLRRIVEALICDPHTARVAHLKLDSLRTRSEVGSAPDREKPPWPPTKLPNASQPPHGSRSSPSKVKTTPTQRP